MIHTGSKDPREYRMFRSTKTIAVDILSLAHAAVEGEVQQNGAQTFMVSISKVKESS